MGSLLFLSGIGPRVRGSREIPGVKLRADGSVESYQIEAQCRSDAAVAALLEGVGDPDWRIRQAAARTLGALGLQQAAGHLASLTADPRNAVRVAAGEALERLGQA